MLFYKAYILLKIIKLFLKNIIIIKSNNIIKWLKEEKLKKVNNKKTKGKKKMNEFMKAKEDKKKRFRQF